jgi:hypothetical protein
VPQRRPGAIDPATSPAGRPGETVPVVLGGPFNRSRQNASFSRHVLRSPCESAVFDRFPSKNTLER